MAFAVIAGQSISASLRGLDLFGADPSVDFPSVIRQLHALKPVKKASQILIDRGISALDNAERLLAGAPLNFGAAIKAGFKQSIFPGGPVLKYLLTDNPAAQPGEKRKRAEIRSHLEFYLKNPNQLESGFYDIRSWTEKAFVAFNAVAEVEGASLFWPSVIEAIEEAPEIIGKVVSKAAEKLAKGVGSTFFAFLTGLFSSPLGLAVLAGGGYLLIRKKPAGETVRHTVRSAASRAGLSGTPEHHFHAGRVLDDEVVSIARLAKEDAEQGRCIMAQGRMTRMEQALGAAAAHHRESSRGRMSPSAIRESFAARNAFERHCVRGRK